MADDNQCTTTATTQAALTAAKKVVILAFDVADQTIINSPDLLSSTLQSKPVQEAIKKALEQFILPRVPTTAGALTEEDAKALLKTLQGTTAPAISKDLLDKIKKSYGYKDLEASINDFLATAACTPLGSWVNANKTLVLVSGLVLTLGGAVALFVTKTGGPVIELPLAQLKDAKVPLFKLGSLSGSATFGELKPSISEAGAGIILTDKFESISLDLKIAATGFFSPSKQLQNTVVTKSSVFTIDPNGGDPKNNRISLGLTLRSNQGNFTAAIGAILEKDQAPKGTLDASLKINKNIAIGAKGVVSPNGTAALATFNLLDF